ncbi:MAG: glycosyltransferase family 9 protein, partial [Candidatus Eiseniibacteriota bacterium]
PRDGYVVVAPGASFGPAKQWEAARFVEAVAGMTSRGDRALVIVGAGDDRDVAAAVAEGARAARVPCADLAGQTQLPDLIGILAGAEAVLSNDSGVMHVAAALGRPTVAVFGSTSPVWTSVSAPWVTNLYAAYPCSPCYRRTCPIGYGCLRSITPSQASAALDQRRTRE